VTGATLQEHLADYLWCGKVRSGTYLFRPGNLRDKFFHLYFFIQAVASVALLVISWKLRDWVSVLWIIAIGLSSIALHLTNYGFTDLPLIALLSTVALKLWTQNEISGRTFAFLSILLCGGFYLNNIVGLIEATGYASNRSAFPVVNVGGMRSFYVLAADGVNNENYTEKLMEGVLLIRRNAAHPERIAVFDFSNPFNVLLQVRAPKGLPILWQDNVSFSKTLYPPFASTFADSTMIMIPKGRDPEVTDPMLRMYRKALDAAFVKKAESPRWILMQRR